MVSEQETKKQPPMEVSQIHTLKLLIETIANLIDLYKSNTNQSQNSYRPKNLGVGSKRTAATTTQANNRRRNISLPPNRNHIEYAHKDRLPKPKKTYADALVDGGKRVCGGLTPVVVAAPVTETGENKEGWITAVIGNHSVAPPATDSSVGGSSNTGRQQHPSNSEAAAAAAEGATAEAAEGAASAADEAGAAAEALKRRRRKERRKNGDCSKHDPDVSEDTQNNFAELLSEELKLRETEALENQQRADMALFEATGAGFWQAED